MKKSVIILLLLCLLTGCAKEATTSGKRNNKATTEYEKTSLQEKETASYWIPDSKPHIMVNQFGYDNEGRKSVIFCGKNLPQTFEVIDQSTKTPVYNGKIRLNVKEGSQTDTVGYAYFTELEQSGTYYIRADIIGQSYPFTIEENAKQKLFLEISKNCYQALEKSEENHQELLEVAPALVAVELYKEAFQDDLGVSKSNNGIPDIVDAVKIYLDPYLIKLKTEYDSPQEALAAAGILAQFSHIYKEYDAKYAMQCSTAAEDLWNYADKSEFQGEETAYFAAAELYKATGKDKYHLALKNYIQSKKEDKEEVTLKRYGDIAYLSTRRKVDIDLCAHIMKEMMNSVGTTYSQSQTGIALIQGESIQKMLDKVLQMGIVAYVATSHEYSNIIENQMNYLLGCNEKGTNFKEELKENTQFLFMLSAIVENDKKIDL